MESGYSNSFNTGSSSLPLYVTFDAKLRELAYVRRNPIEGRKSIFASLTRPVGSSSTIAIGGSINNAGPMHGNGNGVGGIGNGGENSKVGDFMYYESSDDEDFEVQGLGTSAAGEQLSCNFVDYLSARESGMPKVGGGRFFPERLSTEYGTRHMLANAMMKETSVLMPNMDKIFCSKWLSHRQVVFGTKCSKVRETENIE